MDPIKNPFSPGAGTRPPELVGRDAILEQAEILLARLHEGRPERSMLLTGLRGVGKTVLLNEIEHRARGRGHRTVLVEASDGTSLAALTAPRMRRLLFELDRLAGTGNAVRRAMAVLGSFVRTIRFDAGGVGFGIDIEPELVSCHTCSVGLGW
ncbi:MAG: ATP-binding protein [Trueperaceae bacterium]|nr:ATP-binding protein [Trueperaceae bacterium]